MSSRHVMLKLLDGLELNDFPYGCGGIKLFRSDKIKAAQVGYSIAQNGVSLCGDGKGEWRSSWIVIGYESSLGDPIFVDLNDPESAVFTAIHGVGNWEAQQIATSAASFFQSLNELKELSARGRSPEDREAIRENERELFVDRIASHNKSEIDRDFWGSLLEL